MSEELRRTEPHTMTDHMHRPYDPLNAVQIVHFERFLPLLMRYDMGALIKRTAVQKTMLSRKQGEDAHPHQTAAVEYAYGQYNKQILLT